MDDQGYKLKGSALRRLQKQLTRDENRPEDASTVTISRGTSGTSIAWQRGTNASGSTIPAWSVVAIGAVTKTADGFLAALTQSVGSASVKYGLTGSNDCPSYGPSGPSLCSFHLEAGWATYDSSGTPAPREIWGPKSGQFTLSKSYPGFEVVRVIDASRKIVSVVPQVTVSLLGKTAAYIPKNYSGTVNIWGGAGGAEALVTGLTVTAFNKQLDITSGRWVKVDFINGVPYITWTQGAGLLGKTAAAIAKGASGNVTIYAGTQGSESSTGQTLSCYNRFAAVAITKWVSILDDGDGPYLIAAEC